MTLGGGVELCLAADHVCASAETYYGLVEAGVGLIPAGGGCKELSVRLSKALANKAGVDAQPFVNQLFETIGMAKVSTSAHDARRLGLLRESDTIVMNRDRLLHEAKKAALYLAESGYSPPDKQREQVRAVGKDGKAVLQLGAWLMQQGGHISEHDLLIASKLAHVLAGGDVPAGTSLASNICSIWSGKPSSACAGSRRRSNACSTCWQPASRCAISRHAITDDDTIQRRMNDERKPSSLRLSVRRSAKRSAAHFANARRGFGKSSAGKRDRASARRGEVLM